MIIFLYGPDDYRRLQKKNEIIAEFERKRSGLGLAYFDLLQKDVVDALWEFLVNQSIFETSKLAVVENAFELPAEKIASVLKEASAMPGVQVLLAEHDKPLKAFDFLLKPPVLSQKFETLDAAELTQFAATSAKQRGISLAPAAAQFLAAVYAGSTWALITELDKLASLKPGGTIDRRDLDAFDLEAAPNYWALITGLKSRDVRHRLTALETLLAANDPAAKIFNIVAAQAAEKTSHMAEFDLAVKSGRLEYEEAILDAVL